MLLFTKMETFWVRYITCTCTYSSWVFINFTYKTYYFYLDKCDGQVIISKEPFLKNLDRFHAFIFLFITFSMVLGFFFSKLKLIINIIVAKWINCYIHCENFSHFIQRITLGCCWESNDFLCYSCLWFDFMFQSRQWFFSLQCIIRFVFLLICLYLLIDLIKKPKSNDI